ncbi:uncharacterized protein LOC122353190 isoform X2 [Puntigrus tetrazona]|uniref:uncharacterized protein LOC122353190 isoform X2 n=1 Tax=Puntigrus tetrazona TaxID=1606681 RepID=UPI001C88E60C|nr:uncharacterized protein LOC122353190 isoform X2 [Puntigrus tetrazona]
MMVLGRLWDHRLKIIFPTGPLMQTRRSVSTAQLKMRALIAHPFLAMQRLHVQLGLSETQKDSTHQSLEQHYHSKPLWTNEVSEMVALMTHGRLGSPLSAFGSSDSEDVAEQQLHLQDRYSVNSYQESETQESTDLEQLFKSFAGIQSDSEESTNYHTINHNFDVTNGVLEATSQTEDEESSDLDCRQTQQSSMFFTPKYHLSNRSSSGEAHSQSLILEDDLDVTVEVCRPNTSPAEGKQTAEKSLSEYQLSQEDSKKSITPVHRCIPTISCLPDLAEIADLSSISCSPAHRLEWAESAESPPIPLSRGHPPCNSTPRSPKGHRTPLKDVQVPHLQSLLDTSLWGSAPSNTICTKSYTTVSAGDINTTNDSVFSVLQSPVKNNVSKDGREEIDSPSRQTTESSQGTNEEHPVENNDVGEEVGVDNPSNSDGHENTAEKMEGCEGENPCQIHDHHLNHNPADNEESQKRDKSHTLDETERASSTLDEDLERMFLKRATEHKNPREPGSLMSDMKGEGDVREDLSCPEGDYIETASECLNKLGEKVEAADQNHPNRVLEQTLPESVKLHC